MAEQAPSASISPPTSHIQEKPTENAKNSENNVSTPILVLDGLAGAGISEWGVLLYVCVCGCSGCVSLLQVALSV